jgi:hypothetical protein
LWRSFTQHATFADIWPFGVFTNHNKVMRRCVSGCRACKWSTIDIQVQLKTHLEQQPTLNHTRRYARRANCAKQDRIKAGSNEKMNRVGSKAAPSAADFKQAAKTAKPEKKK